MRQIMMKKQTKTVTKKILTWVPLVMLFVFIAGRAQAQKAPPYSNDIMMDNQTYTFLMFDRLEFYHIDGNPIILDAQAWIGKDLHKFWFEVEGEALTAETEGEVELEGLYGWAISPYFDARVGIRYDIAYTSVDTRGRGFAVIGVQGLAPYLFEVETNLFMDWEGNVSAEAEAEYSFPVTQRLWGQVSAATSVAIQDVPEWNVGSGFNDVQLGFRLRYEIEREFAPYVGISWKQKLGETADLVCADGGETSTFGLVGGVRMWF